MESGGTSSLRRREFPTWGFAVVLVVLLFVAYIRAMGGDFLWDDDSHVSANPRIIGPEGLAEIWTTGAANYFPLVLTNFWMQHALWGLNPIGYHVVTFGFHVTAALLLWRVLADLRVPGAWLGAALWALHPVQVESVAWICELKNTQSAVFFLLACSSWLAWLRDDRRRGKYVLTLVWALAALLSKPSTVMLPVVLVLIFWWERRRFPRLGEVLPLAPFFALSLLMSGWTIWEQKYHSGAVGAEWSQSPVERMIISGRVLWFYLGKLVWPESLSFIYPRWSLDATNPISYVPATMAVGGIVWLFLTRDRRPGAFAAAVYFVALLFPVLGFFDVYFFRYSYVGDHFQYLASIGPAVWLGAIVAVALPRVMPLVGGVAILALTVLSAAHSADFRNSEALWMATVARTPDSAMPWAQLGNVRSEQGRYREAIACFERALRINPKHPEARNHLGIQRLREGRNEEAVAEFQRALEARAAFPEAALNLGIGLQRLGRLDEADRHFAAAAAARPTAYEPHFRMARGLAIRGRAADSLPEFETALRLAPPIHIAELDHGYATALCEVGRVNDAMPYFEKVLRQQPDNAQAHDDYGLALSSLGRGDEAAREHERALVLNPQLASAHNNLGVLLAQAGNIPAALEKFTKAAQLNPNYGDAEINRGMALFALQRQAEALAAFKRAVELQPASAKAHAFYAQALHAAGREMEANREMDRASRLQQGAR